MTGFSATLWSALGGICSWRAERSLRRSQWWAKQAREFQRRARGKAEVRR